MARLGIIFISLFITLFSFTQKENYKTKPNVLFLYMDDLRPELGAYGKQHIKSPNIDAFAKKSVVFTRAYCNVAVCGASRASLLTGLRPTKNRFRDYKTFVQKEVPNAITLPQLFKQNGYKTISNGKIYHHLDDRTSDWDEIYRPYAFDENPENLSPTDWWQTLWRDYHIPSNKKEYQLTNKGPAFENADVNDSIYIDGIMTKKVIKDLEKLKNSKKPFFLTAGFISPHLPFNAPKHHWKKYSTKDVKLPTNNKPVKNLAKVPFSINHEIRSYNGIPKHKEPISDELSLKLLKSYYATVSYVDTLIGAILSKLKETGLDKNTIVILVSDHGYDLQEHNNWGKWTSYETSGKVPLIVYNPYNKTKGNTNTLVELVDVYPTLAELCKLNTPNNTLDGESFVKQMKDLNSEGKSVVFFNNKNDYGIRTNRYRYYEYIEPKTNKIKARVLFDYFKDSKETENLSELTEYKEVVVELHKKLHSKFKTNLYGK